MPTENENGKGRQDNPEDGVFFQSGNSSPQLSNKLSSSSAVKTPGLSKSTTSSPSQNSHNDRDSIQEDLKHETQISRNLSPSDDSSEDSEPFEGAVYIGSQYEGPTEAEINLTLEGHNNNIMFIRPNNMLDDIHEEGSSEIEDDDYWNDSVTDSASHNVAIHNNNRYNCK